MSNSQLYLNSTVFLFAILILISPVSTHCPAPSLHGFIISGQIVAALNDGALPLREGQDHLCYNYSLPYQLSRSPEIALSVSGFQVEPSQKLNFYIKPIKSDSYSSISFVIRLQWLYTKWSQLTFNFIMEDRTDIQSGYYQIDTGPLVGCGTLKSTQILLPFRTILNMRKNIKHSLFLHGFQISTVAQERLTENKNQKYNNIRNSLALGSHQKYNNSIRTPFQISINNSFVNGSGIVLTISVSTLTKVDSLYVGYIALENGGFRYTTGTYIFNVNVQKVLAHEPSPFISRNYARIYGINGFLINYKSQPLSFNTNWNSFAFLFDFQKYQNSVQYLSFSYAFFLGSQCDQCPGYPYLNDNTCVSSCPPATFLTEQNFCINCGLGRQWNGTTCILICPPTQFLNETTNLCQCPPTLHWNGQYCMACTNNRNFNSVSKTCQCPGSLIWNSQTCMRKPECTSGRVFDIFTYSCICSELNYWNGTSCTPIPNCKDNQILNSQFLCVCKQGYHWNGQICDYSPCLDGQLWTGTNCLCPIGLYFNGTRCIECINGQKWNKLTSKCQCQGGYKWNGLFCEKSKMCEGNRVWDQTYKQCICSKNSYWSGYMCIPIPLCSSEQYFDIILLKCVCQSGYNYDGFKCIKCQNDRVWNFTILKCVCPPGSTQIPQGCSFKQACSPGKVWVPSTRSCQCPVYTVWNGNACISNPCPFGKRWNFQFKSCQCLNNTIQVKGACMPPQITCTNGRVWNPVIYACQCPPNTFLNYARCDEIPKCFQGKIYNPIINQCVCPRGLIETFSKCVEPECGEGQYYNGLKCQIVRCPPPTYFKNNRCISGPASKNCQFSFYWNGQRCVYYSNQCPFGTKWERQRCISNGTCKLGQYSKNGVCTPLSQKCFPPLIWNGKACKFGTNICPNGTFWSINKCIPFNDCKNGAVWDSTYMKCLCPYGTISNGLGCISCDNNKIWNIQTGCTCPEGTFDIGGNCQIISLESKCLAISNTIWNNKKCVCRPGFMKVNLQCVCYGIQSGGLCDRCSHKPNSQWVSSSKACQCIKGYIQYKGSCFYEKQRNVIGQDQSSSCTVSTYFNSINKMCLPCPEGCLSCSNSYLCQVCRPQFLYEPQTDKCVQFCGDGKKFSFECDDGNNNDNDGCSRDCRLEEGFYCLGGSPEAKDSCYLLQPKQVKMQLIGQIRQHSSITLNVKLDYIPILMIKKSDCLTSCHFFNATIVSGDNSSISISSKYVQGTKYVFAINIQFGKPYIGSFQAQILINPKEVSQYFGTVSTKSRLIVPVNPAYLSTIQLSDKLF